MDAFTITIRAEYNERGESIFVLHGPRWVLMTLSNNFCSGHSRSDQIQYQDIPMLMAFKSADIDDSMLVLSINLPDGHVLLHNIDDDICKWLHMTINCILIDSGLFNTHEEIDRGVMLTVSKK